MKIMSCIKKGLFLVLGVGLLLTGKEVTVKAADKVPLTADVFKDEAILKDLQWRDTDKDGYLDEDEIAKIYYIQPGYNDIVKSVAGLEYLTSLEQVNFAYSGKSIKFPKTVTKIDLRIDASTFSVEASGAKEVSISTYWNGTKTTSCKTLDVSKCNSLVQLGINANGITSYKLPKNGGSIEKITFYNSSIKKMKMPVIKNLTTLVVDGNKDLASIDLESLTNLENLTVKNNPKLKTISLAKNKKLKTLECFNNPISKLDISNNTNLEFLSCPKNQLTSLDCSKNKKLTALECYANKLTTLAVKKAVSLEDVSCENNQLKSLDLSQNNKLKNVSCYGNPLKSIYIKGKTNILKNVSVAPIIESVKSNESAYLTVKLKKNNKIKKYIVLVDTDWDYTFEKLQEDLTFEFNSGTGRCGVRAVSGVEYKDVMVFAKEISYKKKVMVN